jgi:hypothetical protein
MSRLLRRSSFLLRPFTFTVLLACVACDEADGGGGAGDCYLGSGLTATSGSLAIDYEGFVGAAPSDGMAMFLSTQQAERLYFQGCRKVGDDLWWLDLDVELATTAERPAPFELLDPNAARITALISRCAGGDCASAWRSWFGGGPNEIVLEGTLDEFDPVAGRLGLAATLIDIAPGTLETSAFGVTADLTWESTYTPQLEPPLDGRFRIELAPDETGELDFTVEITQEGAALSGHVCDEPGDDECAGAELSGAVADPRIRLFWNDETSGAPVATQLHATFSDTGDDFTGMVSNDTRVRRIVGRRAP